MDDFIKKAVIGKAARLMLDAIDPTWRTHKGLKRTPERVAKSFQEIFSGYGQEPADIFVEFEESYDEVVLVKDVEFFSVCEHHMLPFFGKVHIAYRPRDNKVVGLSKLIRLVDCFAHRLQIQERLCQDITSALMVHLEPYGAACIIQATHLCMQMRGVRKQEPTAITSSLEGEFREDPAMRAELFQLMQLKL